MVDFSHLTKMNIEGKTVEYPLPILGDACLIVSPATEANKPYFNAVLRSSRKTIKAAKVGINAKMLEENRNDDKELYPKLIITGWKGILDKKGKAVEFSPEACQEFLDKLPPWLFDELRSFCGESANFCEQLPDLEEKVGN